MPPPAIRWGDEQHTVEPYLVEGEIHIVVGDGYTGKSFLFLDMGLGLATGQPVFVDCEVARPYRVLFLDEDGTATQTIRRVLGLAAGRGITFCGEVGDRFKVYSGMGFRLDDNERLSQMVTVIERHEPEIVIFDAFRAFHTGSENDSQVMTGLIRHTLRPLAKKYGLTIILLHHTNKEPSDWYSSGHRNASTASRGSTEIRNAADTLLYIERQSDIPVLTVDKARNLEDSEKPDPLAFQPQRQDDESIRIVRVEGVGSPQRPKAEHARRDLEAALPPGSTTEMTHKELLARLPGLKERKYGERTARDVLQGLKGDVFKTREEGNRVYYSRA